jgi:hypothetical protein
MTTFISFPSKSGLGLSITTWIKLLYNLDRKSYIYCGEPVEIINGKIVNPIVVYESTSIKCIEFKKTPVFSFYILDKLISKCTDEVYLLIEGDDFKILNRRFFEEHKFGLDSYPAAILLELENRSIPYHLIIYPDKNILEHGVKILDYIEKSSLLKLGAEKFEEALKELMEEDKININKLLYF